MNIVNDTPFEVAGIMGKVAYPRDTLTLIVKASYQMAPDQELMPLEHGDHLPLDGDRHTDGDPRASLLYASDFAYFKPRADVLLVGRCHVPQGQPVGACPVLMRVGALEKKLMVFGKRSLTSSFIGRSTIDAPEPFDTMTLRYENSFGGPGHMANPVGKGVGAETEEMANIRLMAGEQLVDETGPVPAGFGPLDPTWSFRSSHTGTYSDQWQRTRWPWYPRDFDWSYFNAAPPDQQVEGYLTGDEALWLENLHPRHQGYRCRLPGVRVRLFLAETFDDDPRFREVAMNLDTLWVDMDDEKAVLVWRGVAVVATEDARQVDDVFVTEENINAPVRPLADYRARWTTLKNSDGPLVEDGPLAPPPDPESVDPVTKADASTPSTPASAVSAMEQAHTALTHAGLDDNVLDALSTEDDPGRFIGQLVRELGLMPEAGVAAASAAHHHLHQLLADHGHDPTVMDKLKTAFRFDDPAEQGTAEPSVGRATADRISDADRPADDRSAGLDFRGRRMEAADFKDGRLDGADFTNAHLSGADFSGARLSGADFSGADLTEARFNDADISGAIFSTSGLTDADLTDAIGQAADFSGADLTRADLTRASLTDATMTGILATDALLADTDLSGTDIRAGDLTGCRCDHALFESTRLDQAVFRKASGKGASFHDSQLVDADFSGGSFIEARFSDCRLDGADFRDADLSRAVFEGATGKDIVMAGATLDGLRAGSQVCLAHADFCGARGTGAIFNDARLPGADFTTCRMKRAGFTDADLSGIRCRGADFSHSNFTRAMLVQADMAHTNLFQCRMEGADLTNARLVDSNLYEVEFNSAVIQGTDFYQANLKATKLALLTT